MQTIGTPGFAALPASAVAGPVFVLSGVASLLYAQLPQPIAIRPEDVAGVMMILIPATVIGFLLAYIPNFVGSLIMEVVARHSETAREPILWVAAGALAGVGITALFAGFDPAGAAFRADRHLRFCAWICRRQFDWSRMR